MAIQTVFSNNLDPTTGSLTSRFTNATGFYIDAPLLNEEIEIDVFLQVYFPTESKERVRVLALGKLSDGQIKLNETDTETVKAIPKEFVDSGLEMALYFWSSDNTFLEVFVVVPDCSLCQIQGGVLSLLEEFDRINSPNQNLNAGFL